jgi:hypothetical protein
MMEYNLKKTTVLKSDDAIGEEEDMTSDNLSSSKSSLTNSKEIKEDSEDSAEVKTEAKTAEAKTYKFSPMKNLQSHEQVLIRMETFARRMTID